VRLGDKKVLKYFIDLVPNLLDLLSCKDKQELQNHYEENKEKFPRAVLYVEEVIMKFFEENEDKGIVIT